MAKLSFILQAVTSANHAAAIRELLRLPRPADVIVSVAFFRDQGLEALQEPIRRLGAKARFFVGIRNDITSIQAIKRLLTMKVRVYAVDTGSRNPIFHPKLYFAANDKQANVIVGSANVTWGGLYNNIEASTWIRLDLTDAADKKFSDEAITGFVKMLKSHPRHVFLIKNARHADELFRSGRLADENVIPAPVSVSGVKNGVRDRLPPMKLVRAPRPPAKLRITKPVIALKPVRPGAASLIAPGGSSGKYLVWKSRPLRERDLNIPHGKGTHATGSMGLKKGAVSGIDQRHYFRDQVFAGLRWAREKPPSIWERAEGSFELVIKNLNYGMFDLKLSHNTNKRSRSYVQRNFMTQLHWGATKKYVGKRDLLGRIMCIYRRDTVPPEFMIEID